MELLGVLASVGLWLAAAPADAQVRGGTLRIGMDADNTTMDPHLSTAAVDRQVYNNIYGKLFDIDMKFGIVPQLVQSWEVKSGGLVYVFKLRRGVKFHDGTDFNADIVKWNFDRMRDPALASPRRSEIAPVKDVKVVDPYTVELTLSAPYAPLLSVLTDRAGMMVSKAAVEKYKDDYARNPVGTGPFRFAEWVKDDHLTIKRFEGILGEGPAPSRRGDLPAHSGPVRALHRDAHGPDRRHAPDRAEGRGGGQEREGDQGLRDPEPLVARHALEQPGGALHEQADPPGHLVRGGPHGDPARGVSGARHAGLGSVPLEHVGAGHGLLRLAA
jgi:hypothetical protein